MSAYDLLVVGGGPAGCAAALRARQAGLSVGLLSRPDRGPGPVGVVESLPAASRRLLVDLGCWPAFQRLAPAASRGVHSTWGSPAPVERAGLRDPEGSGWHVDRRLFDGFLRAQAVAAGAVLRTGRLVSVRRTDAGLECIADCGAVLSGRFVLDASGRSASVAARLGARRRYSDDSVATMRSYRSGPDDLDRRTIIEAAPDGWWYSVHSGADSRTVGRIGDPDRPAGEPPRSIARLLTDAAEQGEPHRVAANSARLDPAVGEGWAAAGDAALSFDPLSSQGILTALFTGRAAAEAAARWLAGDPGALTGYAQRLTAIEQAYRWNLRQYYRAEQRWAAEKFWARRS